MQDIAEQRRNNVVAIRIARASTKKDKILFCGYHGWHDWYLSANLKSEILNEHLYLVWSL